jgi:hypothetical protein
MHYDAAKLYVILQGVGAFGFLTGLAIHIATYTKAIPPEKKKFLGIIAVLQMILGATLVIWPWMMKMVQRWALTIASERCRRIEALHLTNRWSQPLAAVKSTFNFMKQFQVFATLAVASGGSASVSLGLIPWNSYKPRS